MASIEVSLSTTPRRKSGKKSLNGSVTGSVKTATPVAKTTATNLVDSCKELEMLRHALRDKENTIQNLQGQVISTQRPLEASEKRLAELRLQQLRVEEDMRRGNIVRVSEALKKIDSDENNIDVRIRQAELEYELGREELALLGVREEKRVLQARLDAKPTPTLFSCLQPPGKVLLQAVSIECDPKSPKFGAGHLDELPGLRVLWATEESGLRKGDRILEVNGKLTLSTTREEMTRLLSVCPSRAEIVVCRPWTPPPSPTADDLLRRENLRLTHRISYLEDQVADLLNFKEKALTPQIEVFQKGSQVTVISSPESTRASYPRHNDLPSDSDQSWRRPHSDAVGPSQQYQEGDSLKPSIPDKSRSLTRKYENGISKDDRLSTISTVYLNAGKNSSTTTMNSLSDLEKSGRRSKEAHRTVDYSSETTCPRYRSHRDRSVKSLDLDADTSGQDTLSRQPKPAPPKKPLRLAIQRATSLQSMAMAQASSPRRGKHKGIAPPPPPTCEPPEQDAYGYHWAGHFHKNRSKGRTVHVGEKWC